MKKIYLILLSFVVSASGLYAQREVGAAIPFSVKAPDMSGLTMSREVSDTIAPTLLSDCPMGLMLLQTNVGGFVTGGNGYGDLEKAQFIATFSNGLVHTALVFVGAKEGGSNESYVAKLYSGDTADGPDAVFGTSMPVNYADLDTVSGLTTFTFDPPVAYDGSFFISLEVAQGDAIFGIVHTDDGCGNESAWEMWDDGSWFSIDEAWGDLDISMIILAGVESTTVSVEDTQLIAQGSAQIFPNPATTEANLVYSVVESTNINVHVYSLAGVLLNSYNQGIQLPGMNQMTFDTGNLSPGMYIYSIQTDDGFSNGRFTVTR